jgi:hypothetical protein
MSTRSGQLSDYKLLFELLDDGVATLEADALMQFRESVQISEEVEALRAITDQVNAETSGIHSLTVGHL